MSKTTYSDEACGIILMHHTIKNLNRQLSSEIARIYGQKADYSRSFKEISRGFSDSETYKKYLTQAHNDSKSIYSRLQPLTLFEYNAYLTHILMFLQENDGTTITDAVKNAKDMLNFYPPRFYSDYAGARTIPSADLIRGLKYIKQVASSAYEIAPDAIIVNGAHQVITDRINLECNREISKQNKKKAKGSIKTQRAAAKDMGGAELLSPFSIDNLISGESATSNPEKEKGED